MRRNGARLGIASFVASVAVIISIVAGQVASAATITKHSGTWHVSGGILNSRTVDTRLYSTYTKAETCVDIKSNNNSDVWTIRLIWYNAGNNTFLWTLAGQGKGTYCSGWRKMSHPDDKVYVSVNAKALQSMKGTYNIWTN